MNSAAHRLVFASAGTGKTHALCARYVRLLLLGCPSERILATTFTRKASGEILHRVLAWLTDAAGSDEACRRLRSVVELPLLDRSRCAETLAEFVRSFDRCRIATLDSVLVNLSRSLEARPETNLGAVILTEPEDAELRADAMEDVLDEMTHPEVLRLVQLLHPERLRVHVMAPLQQRAGSLLMHAAASPAAVWSAVSPVGARLDPESLRRAIDQLTKMTLPLTKKGEPNSTWSKAREHAAASARREDWQDLLTSGIAKSLLAEASHFAKVEIADDTRAVFEPLIEHARWTLTSGLCAANEAVGSFAGRFESRLRRLKADVGAASLSDMTRALCESEAAADLEHVQFRLDGQLDHVLLDEFQDTSATQFRVIRRLIEEIVGDVEGARSFFAVGDLKQSLYLWRDADSDMLLANLDAMPGITRDSLDETRRCGREVVRAVNLVCGGVGRLESDAPSADAAMRKWSRVFHEHRGARTEGGEVRLAVLSGTGEGEDGGHDLAAVADRVSRLVLERPNASVGVLFLKRRRIAGMVSALRRRGIPASQEGATPVTDSPLVSVMMSVLRFADSPYDAAAHLHVASSVLGTALGIERDQSAPRRDRIAFEMRAVLVNEGYARTLARWGESAAKRCGGAERERFEVMLDLAGRFDRRATLRPIDLARMIERTPAHSASGAGVRVMTVHGSKGLEFDAVFLPELDEPLSGSKSANALIDRDPISGEIVAASLSSSLLASLHPTLLRLNNEELRRRAYGQLCQLYVAMTRARDVLELFVEPRDPAKDPGEEGAVRTVADIVCAGLSPGVPRAPEALLYQSGESTDRDPAAGRAPRTLSCSDILGEQRPRSLEHEVAERSSPVAARVPVASAPPANDREDLTERVRAASLSVASLARGIAFHSWLESIEWIESFRADDEAMRRRAAIAVERPEGTLRAWLAEFRALLARPGLRSVLSERNTAARLRGGSPRVWRELDIYRTESREGRDERGASLGRIDRVSVGFEGSRATSAEIVDFKTDRADEVSDAEIQDRYGAQVSSYRDSIASVFRIDRRRVSAGVYLLSADRWVPMREP